MSPPRCACACCRVRALQDAGRWVASPPSCASTALLALLSALSFVPGRGSVVFACRSFPRSSSTTTLFVCVDCYMFWTDSLLSRVLYNTAENCNSFQNLYELFVSRVRNLTFAMRELCESRCGLSRQCIFTFLSTRFITQSTRRVDMVLYVV